MCCLYNPSCICTVYTVIHMLSRGSYRLKHRLRLFCACSKLQSNYLVLRKMCIRIGAFFFTGRTFLQKKKRYRCAFHASDISSTLPIHIGITVPFIRHHTFCSSDTITSCFLCCFRILPYNYGSDQYNTDNIGNPGWEDQHQTCHNKQNTL